MKKHARGSDFWERWVEMEQGGDAEEGPGRRALWRHFIAQFIGVPPEKHWLFKGRRFKHWVSGDWGPPIQFNPFVAEVLSKGGGLLSLYVLHLLSEQPRYGNDIMREIEERTEGRWAANPGAVYPLLSVMEKRDLIEGEWEQPTKRTRRIYRLTEAGHQELSRLKAVMRPMLEEAISILRSLHADMEEGHGGKSDI